jgi:hypothetical protein
MENMIQFFKSKIIDIKQNRVEPLFVSHKIRSTNFGFFALDINHKNFNLIALVYMIFSLIKWIYLGYIGTNDKFISSMILGDIYLYYGGVRYYLILCSALASLLTSYLIYLFNFDRHQSWQQIFNSLGGHNALILICFIDEDSIRKLVKRIELTYFMATIMSNSFIWTSWILSTFLVLSNIEYDINSILWISGLTHHLIWCYLAGNTIIYSFGIFFVICYYCSLSIKALNANLDLIFSLNKVKPQILNKALDKYNAIHKTISELNKFWKEYYLASIFTLIPVNVICLHQTFYSKLDKSVIAILLVTAFNSSVFIFFVNFISASIPFEIRKPFKKLSFLQWKIKFEAINSKIKVCKSYLQ